MWIDKIMNMMVNSCKKTTELIDKKQLVPLTAKEKMQLKVHTSMCKTCNAYENQSQLIDKIIGNWFKGSTNAIVKMPEEIKFRIIDNLHKI